MKMLARRPVAVLLLALFTTQACSRTVTADGPHPGQEIDGIVLRNGERIMIPSSYAVTLDDSLMHVHRLRDGSFVRAYPLADIERVVQKEFSPGRTGLLVGGIAAVLVGLWLMAVSAAGVPAGTFCWGCTAGDILHNTGIGAAVDGGAGLVVGLAVDLLDD